MTEESSELLVLVELFLVGTLSGVTRQVSDKEPELTCLLSSCFVEPTCLSARFTDVKIRELEGLGDLCKAILEDRLELDGDEL